MLSMVPLTLRCCVFDLTVELGELSLEQSARLCCLKGLFDSKVLAKLLLEQSLRSWDLILDVLFGELVELLA